MNSFKRRLYSGLLLGALAVFAVILVATWDCFKLAWLVEPLHPRIPTAINDLKDLGVAITSPRNGSDDLPTSQHVPIEGTYSGDLTARELWVLAYSFNDGKYYPQAIDDPRNPGVCEKLPVLRTPVGASGGHWVTHFFDTNAETLDLMAMVTNTGSAADEYFKQWVKRACEGPFPGGIPAANLPGPLTEKATISVKTK